MDIIHLWVIINSIYSYFLETENVVVFVLRHDLSALIRCEQPQIVKYLVKVSDI